MRKQIHTILSLTSVLVMSLFNELLAQPGPPGGGGGPPCWPPSTCDPGIPINNELWILLAAGLILGIYFLKKNKENTSSID